MRSNKHLFHKMSLSVFVMSLVVVGSSAISRNDVFDSSTNNQWAQDVCASNTTCAEQGKECFTQLRMARRFVESLELVNSDGDSPASLAERCQLEKDNFNECATAANLNVTWNSITGSDRSCEHSFLLGRPPFHRPPHHPYFRRRHRTLPFVWSQFPLPRIVYQERFGSPFPHSVRDLGRRGPQGRGWRGPRRPFQGHKRGLARVEAFLNTLQQTNSAAFQSFDDCSLQQQDLLTDAGDVDRTTFEMLASVAFAAEPEVLADVRIAVQTCQKSALPQLENYMKCLATSCIAAKFA